MSFQRISAFATALLGLAVMGMAVVVYIQLSEIRELREDIAAFQQMSEAENQGLREELVSLRTEMAELDASEDLAAIEQSISRLRLQSLGVWVDDEPLVSLKVPQIAQPSLSVFNMQSLIPESDWWWEQEPESVRTITRSDYGAEWPFETDDALLGCHGGDVLAVVEGIEVMVDSASPSLHSFMADMTLISVLDPSSTEIAEVRERMTEEAQSLCKIVR